MNENKEKTPHPRIPSDIRVYFSLLISEAIMFRERLQPVDDKV